MKKLFLILIACGALSPVLAWADAGGAGATVTDDGQFNLCASYNCACTWQGEFLGNIGALSPAQATSCAPWCAPTDEATCITACQDPEFPNVDPKTGLVIDHNQIAGDYQCLDTNGKIVNVAPLVPDVPATPIQQPIFPELNVKIPGLCDMSPEGKCWGGLQITTKNGAQSSSLLGTYTKYVYLYLLGAATLVAVTMLMIAGLQYATARGDSKQVEQAKKRISNAVVGVILLLLAYNIAFLIDPATTTFDALSIHYVDPVLYVQNSGDVPATSYDYSSITPPAGVICDKTSSVEDVANSFKGKVTYRLGGKGGPPPYPYDTQKDDAGDPYAAYCPEGQLCMDCSGYVGYVAYCAGLPQVNETGGTKGIFASAQKVTACDPTSVNGIALQPGDLLGWGPSTTAYGHVLMYIGNGQLTDASGSGRGEGQAAKTHDVSFACNNYLTADHGLYIVRRPK